jgi:hypothetical protein
VGTILKAVRQYKPLASHKQATSRGSAHCEYQKPQPLLLRSRNS